MYELYDDILSLSFTEARESLHPIEFSHAATKQIGLCKPIGLHTYTDNSDILLMYNLMTDKPLLISERFEILSDVDSRHKILAEVAKFNAYNKEYTAIVNLDVEGMYTEIVVVLHNVYKGVSVDEEEVDC